MNKFKKLRKSLALLLIGSAFAVGNIPVTHAASISLVDHTGDVADSLNVNISESIFLDLIMDFTGEPTIGGGIDIFFDNFTNGDQLTFVNYTPSGLGDPDFQRNPNPNGIGIHDAPTVSTGTGVDKLNGIAFGDFGGLGGSAVIGTLEFLANTPGSFDFSMACNVLPAGCFFSTGFAPQLPDFNGATVNVSAVPIPAAVWLFGSAIGLIGGMRRKATT